MRMFDLKKKFRFRNFRVYAEALVLTKEMRSLARKRFPDSEKHGLIDQISRASSSIVLNIAEGSERGSDKDFAHYLNMANASLNEVVACLDIALDEKYLAKDARDACLERAAGLSNQLSAFRKALARPSSNVKGQRSKAPH